MNELDVVQTNSKAKGRVEGLAEGLAKGLAKRKANGLAEGLAEGFSNGFANGFAKGFVRGLAKGLLKLAKRQFREVPEHLATRVLDAPEEQLHSWYEQVYDAPDLETLLNGGINGKPSS